MKKRVIAVIAVLALSVAMFGCKAGSDTGNGKKQREESAGDMGTEGKATAEEETEIQVFIAIFFSLRKWHFIQLRNKNAHNY